MPKVHRSCRRLLLSRNKSGRGPSAKVTRQRRLAICQHLHCYPPLHRGLRDDPLGGRGHSAPRTGRKIGVRYRTAETSLRDLVGTRARGWLSIQTPSHRATIFAHLPGSCRTARIRTLRRPVVTGEAGSRRFIGTSYSCLKIPLIACSNRNVSEVGKGSSARWPVRDWRGRTPTRDQSVLGSHPTAAATDPSSVSHALTPAGRPPPTTSC